MKCIGLDMYITNSIRSAITNKDTGTCIYIDICIWLIPIL